MQVSSQLPRADRPEFQGFPNRAVLYFERLRDVGDVTLTIMFLTGDELGNIKTLRYFAEGTADGQKTEVKTIHDGTSGEKPKGVQKLCIGSSSDGKKLVSTELFSPCDGGLKVLLKGS